ncbi:MAG: DUF6082 family protein, partial [Catenulispora sp.]
QDKMGPLGQIFESVNTVFSGLGFIALVVTFRLQYDELRLQRQELASQRHAMNRTQKQLRRSAEADIRARHVELMRMSMEDGDLAEIWPEYRSGTTAKCEKQFAYANLVVQHQRMLYNLGVFAKADVHAFFRYAFTNQIMRDFWEARMVARQIAVHHRSAEWKFDNLVDKVYKEVLLSGSQPTSHGSELAACIEPEPESDAA